MNSFPTLITKTRTSASSRRNMKTDRAHKQVWQFRHDENRRRWNKRPKAYRNVLLAALTGVCKGYYEGA